MTALVPKANISGTPSRATANAGFASLWDWLNERFGAGTGTAAEKAATRAALGAAKDLQPISASVAANALTLTLNPTNLDFRSATLTSGTVNTRTVPVAISVVVSSGSTLGTTNATLSRLAVLAIDNAGTVELAVVNIATSQSLDETGVISTTAEGGSGGADSAVTIYSTTARTNVPYRLVGFVESTQATAGTWATAPSLIQGAGGNALVAASSFGYAQTPQVVTRTAGVTYTNTTGKPIFVVMYGASINALASLNVNIAGGGPTTITSISPATGYQACFMVPIGATYVIGEVNISTRTTVEWR